MRHVLIASLFALSSCYSPTVHDGQYSCSDGKTCPDGFACASDLTCVRAGEPLDRGTMFDAATENGDLATSSDMVNRVCTNGDSAEVYRSTSGNVAFCRAAWGVPGVSTATPCNRSPGPDGTSSGVPCTTADNCAVGWHVCKSDFDLLTLGLTSDECKTNSPNALFITQQAGAGQMTNDCGMSVAMSGILGCGGIGAVEKSAHCNVVARNFSSPCDIFPPWNCALTGPETVSISKSGLSAGGVLCCKD